jgi:hypothetical protein
LCSMMPVKISASKDEFLRQLKLDVSKHGDKVIFEEIWVRIVPTPASIWTYWVLIC